MESVVGIGMLFILLGMLIIFIGSFAAQESRTKIAFGGIIGFIPFGFGNDKSMVKFAVAISIAAAVLMIIHSRIGK